MRDLFTTSRGINTSKRDGYINKSDFSVDMSSVLEVMQGIDAASKDGNTTFPLLDTLHSYGIII
ncbi:hypothetical protein H8B06_18035 [Sphingobacterium sp. DN00404]|uniref:Uncharacterized protein n=1 Tax=Sphingobacterium micropteri TaxID=2763501 RepID=A0ABR7YU89_9SPHI|nr:hypothetical protein [Sphingobacterium micropteri]MBD1434731.1 hypothetical protein [Sphingobacterium micropteri]